MSALTISWIVFNLFIILMLALDLGVFHRKAHVVSIREALIWSVVWTVLSLLMGLIIWQFWDVISPDSALSNDQAGLAYITGYVIEKSLSVDNLFVFALIFSAFNVPREYQHRVLFWGVFGALVMRGAMIGVGAVLIEHFSWILYFFGGLLLFSGIKMAFHRGGDKVDPTHNPVLKVCRRYLPVSEQLNGDRFLVRHKGKLMVTPLFLVLVLLETSDLVFAVDSIPAIFSVTREAFLVYSANIMAILGLRSLYFVLAGMMHRFCYLSMGLSVVLCFIGVKMLLLDVFHIPTQFSLGIVLSILTVSILASVMKKSENSQV